MESYYIVKMEGVQKEEFEKKLAEFQRLLYDNANFHSYETIWEAMSDDNKKKISVWFYDNNPVSELNIGDITVPEQFNTFLTSIKPKNSSAGSRRRRRRPSRKYKKSAKRVFRKKSRSTRRR